MITGSWTPVGRAADVPLLEGRSVAFEGRRVAIFHLPDGWAAVEHACPHAGGPLADGIVSDSCVTCPLHGARFDLHTGERAGSERETLVTYPVRERGGILELRAARETALEQAA
ncbi:MAG: nitrite reductase (NAD(P)H) small subunit [Actinomycetota bacterium]|nr:nitrite reductase (NAD(P)H) small subunit [Actinomycetota bacterium]